MTERSLKWAGSEGRQTELSGKEESKASQRDFRVEASPEALFPWMQHWRGWARHTQPHDQIVPLSWGVTVRERKEQREKERQSIVLSVSTSGSEYGSACKHSMAKSDVEGHVYGTPTTTWQHN